MSERGVFAVDRGIWDHPTFASRDPFSRREAWLWLVSEAAWKSRVRRIGAAVIEIVRGQLAHSIRFMAEAWGWPKSNVARFLACLKTDTMIDTKTVHGITIVTVCKYDEYQRVSLPDRDNTGTHIGTAAGQQRDKLEDIKNIKEDSCAVEKVVPAKPLRFEEFWAEYPKRDGANPKQAAEKAFNAALKSGADPQAIIDGAKRHCADMQRRGKIKTEYVPQAVTWLHRRGWADEQLPLVPSPDKPKADWDLTMKAYTGGRPGMRSNWYWGPEPGEPGCQVPPEIQRKHGFEPAGEIAA
jgi:hypothetical protein